jgi:isoamylase
MLNKRRTLRDVEHERQRVSLTDLIRRARNAWHGVKLHQPDWSDQSHSVAFSAELRQEGLCVYVALNAYWERLDFQLPPLGDGGPKTWCRWIDTMRESPQDIVPWQSAPSLSGHCYQAGPRSVVVLFGQIGHEERPR